ncbi:hypothetical protein M0R45_036501 [Rubus argutus]|uniref:ATP synthase F0 subunit 8 n=1 Tax=Rubus argutus TaxID=59490 RepID=A0AAW1W0D2_RUBAR
MVLRPGGFERAASEHGFWLIRNPARVMTCSGGVELNEMPAAMEARFVVVVVNGDFGADWVAVIVVFAGVWLIWLVWLLIYVDTMELEAKKMESMTGVKGTD